MAIALQWQVAHSTIDKTVVATDRTVNGGAMIVACTCQRGHGHDGRIAASLARAIADAYIVAFACATRDAGLTGKPAEATVDLLSDAVTCGLNRMLRDSRAASVLPSVIAIAVKSSRLAVARWGKGEVYLLRAGALEHLTSGHTFGESPVITGGLDSRREPDLGELELQDEDRLLICTRSVAEALEASQLRHILRDQPSARRTAQSLLEASQAALAVDSHGLAILDFVSPRFGIFPVKPMTSARHVQPLPISKV